MRLLQEKEVRGLTQVLYRSAADTGAAVVATRRRDCEREMSKWSGAYEATFLAIWWNMTCGRTNGGPSGAKENARQRRAATTSSSMRQGTSERGRLRGWGVSARQETRVALCGEEAVFEELFERALGLEDVQDGPVRGYRADTR